MTTTIRVVDNFMSETLLLQCSGQGYKIEPHDRAWMSEHVPVCESEEEFRRHPFELRILAKGETIHLWEAGGQVRFSRDGQWHRDGEPVARLSEAGGGRGIVVGAMGGFWLKRVNV
jgi:hypothetical protein